METVYIGLGSNIEPRYDYLKRAREMIESKGEIEPVACSSIYETAPVGYLDQNRFLNAVMEIKTDLEPLQLLGFLQSVEKDLGRTRDIKWGPRTIDLDILLINKKEIDNEQLKVPHPRILERAFVLIPLAELAPNREIEGKSIREHINRLEIEDGDIKKFNDF